MTGTDASPSGSPADDFSHDVKYLENDEKRSASSRSLTSRSSSLTDVSSHNETAISERQASRRDLSRQVSNNIGAVAAPELNRTQTGRSIMTNATQDPGFEVDFEEVGSDNPKEWSLAYKSMVIFMVSFSTAIVVMYSTAYASGIPGIMHDFNIGNKTLAVLGITTYLTGLAAGSLIVAPLSEMYGRRPVYIISLVFFILLIIPCGLAQNLEAILIARFFGAFAGSAMISNAPGTVADIVTDEYRALAFSIWSIGPMNGPVLGPVVGGFVFQYLGWRWVSWVVMIGSGVSLIFVTIIKETYAPTLLRQKAALRRKATDDERWWSRYDERVEFLPSLRVNLSRPFVMAVTEPILIFWDIYIAIVYAILYLCFVAYPIVFSEQRGWSPGITGLSYVGIGIGGLITISCEPLIRKMINHYRPDKSRPAGPDNQAEPEAMVTVVCISSILIPLGELIFAWTSPPRVHWVAPILAGIPFGAGNCGVFIYASNYLVHSYGIYAASALAGNAVLRSVMGGCLPLAGPSLYAALGSQYAGTLLGCLELVCIPIPFVFWRYGAKIRSKSALIRRMREDQEKLERRKRRALARADGGVSEVEEHVKVDGKAFEKETQLAFAISHDKKFIQLAQDLEDIGKDSATTGKCSEEVRWRLLEAVKATLPQLERQDDAIQRVLYTNYELTAAKIASNLGLFSKLCESDQPLTTNDIAAPINADSRLLERVLKFIASVQLIDEVGKGVFGPNTTTRHLNDPGVLAGIYTSTKIIGPPAVALPDWLAHTNYQTPTVIEDSPFSQGHGEPIALFDWFAKNPEAEAQFGQWMTVQRFGDELWLDKFPFEESVMKGADPTAPLFVDVGGGIGHQCANLIKRYPAVAGRVVLQDQEQLIQQALKVDGLQTQIIDFFVDQPVRNARVYYLRNVLHDWTDEYCVKILTVLKKAMGPNSLIFADEMVVPDKGAHRIAMQVDMTMLANCIAEERSNSRWKELWEKAGLRELQKFQYSPVLCDCIMVLVPEGGGV